MGRSQFGIRSPNGFGVRRYTDPDMPATQRDLDLHTPKFDVSGGPLACHPYTGALDEDGYGRLKINGILPPYKGACRLFRAHAFMFLVAHPEYNWHIPKELTVDHVCHNTAAASGKCLGGSDCLHRRCGNYRHMELTTSATNTRNGLGGIHQRRKNSCTTCGTAYDTDNTYVEIDNLGRVHRKCRTCRKASDDRRKEQRRISRQLASERGK